MDVSEFVKARLDEDEAIVKRNSDGYGLADGYPDYRTYTDGDTGAADDYIDRFGPARMLLEIAAKRATLAVLADFARAFEVFKDKPDALRALTQGAEPYLKVLRGYAAIWSDHPDYRADWAL